MEGKRILLEGGYIVDGTGGTGFMGNVILENDKIVSVTAGELEGSPGERINCAGCIIAPGFIDEHSHNDWFIDRDDPLPYFIPGIEQGVTSAVTGNCGFSAAGYDPGSQGKCAAGYKEDQRDFSDFSAWFNSMDGTMPMNLASLQGHGTMRYSLVGNNPEPLNPAQIEKMRRMAGDALEKGACGISLGLQYAPGMFAPFEELVEMAGIVKQFDRVLTVHTRTLGIISSMYPVVQGGRAHNLLALDEAIKIAKAAGCKLHYSHATFFGEGSFVSNDELLATIDRALSDGVDITFDLFSIDCGMSFITLIMPDWYHALDARQKKRQENLRRFRDEFYEQEKTLKFGFGSMIIANDMVAGCKGKTISQIAGMWGLEPFDAYIRLVDETQGQARVIMNGFICDDIIEKQSRHPRSLYMTDAWYEPGSSQNYNLYGSFPHLLELSRDGRGPKIEEAVRKMTGASAERFGIKDRGLIKENMFADICVFNLDEIKSFKDRKPDGIRHVFINGRHVLNDGKTNLGIMAGSGRSIRIG